MQRRWGLTPYSVAYRFSLWRFLVSLLSEPKDDDSLCPPGSSIATDNSGYQLPLFFSFQKTANVGVEECEPNSFLSASAMRRTDSDTHRGMIAQYRTSGLFAGLADLLRWGK